MFSSAPTDNKYIHEADFRNKDKQPLVSELFFLKGIYRFFICAHR